MLLRRASQRHNGGWCVLVSKSRCCSTTNNPGNAGHYKAEELDTNTKTLSINPDLKVQVTVDEVFDNDHRVVNTKGGAVGKFTFSAADSGEHKICFLPSVAGGGGWLSGGQMSGIIRMTLDIAIGETSQIESTDKSKISEIVQKVKDLNGRLQDIRREQVFQRVCCRSPGHRGPPRGWY